MTENEAIEELKTSIDLAKMCTQNSERKREIEAHEMAIQALEEIQQYRAIGTVEDIQLIFQLCKDLQVMCGKYHEIGTVEDIQQKLAELERWHTTVINDSIKNSFANSSTSICHNCDHKDEYIMELEAELQALKEKAEPKKPITYQKTNRADCPVCGKTVRGIGKPFGDWCADCGQKLDWS